MTEADDLRWYLVNTLARGEWLAHRELRAGGYATLYLHFRGTVRHANRVLGVLKPLFPRYLFVGLQPGQSLYTVNKTRGVATVVYLGGQAVEVPAEVIAEQARRGDASGLVPSDQVPAERQQRQPYNEGERVKFVAGPWQGFGGIVHLDDGEKVALWVEAFNGRVRAVASHDDVAALNPDGGAVPPAAARSR